MELLIWEEQPERRLQTLTPPAHLAEVALRLSARAAAGLRSGPDLVRLADHVP